MMSSPVTHELKTDPEVFDAVAKGFKTYEIRYNDRGYRVGDTLVLLETKYTVQEMREGQYPLIYTGRRYEAKISHIITGPLYGLEAGWVILSLDNRLLLDVARAAMGMRGEAQHHWRCVPPYGCKCICGIDEFDAALARCREAGVSLEEAPNA